MNKITKSSTTILFVLIGLCFGAVGCAQGQERERREPPTFEKLLEEMDSDNDQKLSSLEIKGPLKDVFTEVDTNEDGYITKEEFEKAPRPKRKKAQKNN